MSTSPRGTEGVTAEPIRVILPAGVRVTERGRSRTARLELALALVVLAAIGCAAAAVGGHDAIRAEAFLSRLVGVLLLAAGLTMIFAVLALLWGKEWAPAASAGAATLGALIGGCLLGASVAGGDNALWLLWFGLAGASLLALNVIVRRGELDIWRLGRHPVRFVVSALSVGVLVSLSQFGQSTVYLPSVATPTLDMTSSLGVGPKAHDGVSPLLATLTIKNAGDQQVRLVASHYTVVGWNVGPAKVSDSAFQKRITRSVKDLDVYPFDPAPAERTQRRMQPVLLQSGPILPATWYFDKGEEYTTRVIVYLPAHPHYRYVRLTTTLFAMRATVDVAPEGHFSKVGDLVGGSALVADRPLHETSWVNSLVRADHFLRVVLFVKPTRRDTIFSPLSAFIDRQGRRPRKDLTDDDYTTGLARLYGLVTTESVVELPLK